ncbi:hypothetical protein ACFL35_17390 [Candidatus Riflebacteria bacterium]
MAEIDWQLYKSMKGSTEVNRKLTSALKKKISEAKKDIRKNHREPLWHARKIRCEMYVILLKYANFGAWNLECSIVLVTEIERRLEIEKGSLSRY